MIKHGITRDRFSRVFLLVLTSRRSNSSYGPTRFVSGLSLFGPWPNGINRDCRGRTYSHVRGEILRSWEDELLRKHSARMSSLIKNESVGIEDDQIPS
jgi:hypothetical protein